MIDMTFYRDELTQLKNDDFTTDFAIFTKPLRTDQQTDLPTDRPTDRRTNQQTDQWTDIYSYRDATDASKLLFNIDIIKVIDNGRKHVGRVETRPN